MTKKFACADIGVDCEWHVHGDSEEEILKQVAEHAKTHGFDQVTPELKEKVTSAIKDE